MNGNIRTDIEKLRNVARSAVDVNDSLDRSGNFPSGSPERKFLMATSRLLFELADKFDAAIAAHSEHARHMVAGAASAAGQRDECGMTEVDWKRAEALAYMPRLLDAQIDAIANAMPGGLDGFLKGWGWRQFARQIEDAVLERASPADEMVLDRQVKQWTQERDRLNDLIAHATGAAAGALSDEQSTAYDTIDRFLRNNLDDTNYAEYSAMLDALLAAQPAEPAPTIHEGWTLVRTEVWEELSGKNVPEPAPADRQGVALSVTGDEVRAIVRAAHPGGSDHPSGPDYVMATVAYLNRRASSSRAEVERDAARWNQALRNVKGTRELGQQFFVFTHVEPLQDADIMRGSVAEHFTRAIDAMLAADEAPNEDKGE